MNMNSRSRSKPKPKSRPVIGGPNRSASASLSKSTASPPLLSVDFEIRGKVQGVHFRKYTQGKATGMGIRGWCKNTEHGTVIGCMQGERLKVDMMKDWLKRVGSPKSRIEGAEFKQANSIKEYAYQDFKIVK